VIGKQPPVPDLPPRDAQNRFQMAFRRFLGVFARKESSTSPPQTSRFVGREVAAPPSSASCMTDNGPSQCDELM
jgi:hypothetical protein